MKTRSSRTSWDEAIRKLEQKTADELGKKVLTRLARGTQGPVRRRSHPARAQGHGWRRHHPRDHRGRKSLRQDRLRISRTVMRGGASLCNEALRGQDRRRRRTRGAISLLKFPAETRQLEIRDGAILANPARVSCDCRNPARLHRALALPAPQQPGAREEER